MDPSRDMYDARVFELMYMMLLIYVLAFEVGLEVPTSYDANAIDEHEPFKFCFLPLGPVFSVQAPARIIYPPMMIVQIAVSPCKWVLLKPWRMQLQPVQ
ncbi:hypothetical protein BKA70DRAFT_1290781 [Coprinopsis sp. MPI-PUGE-AT-0042]|nr:hypothetical protein BKA70DRAFT_1290781 [Coprinopsis sp. MPI-PUGE-AT-0042]